MDNFPKWAWIVVLIVVIGGGWYIYQNGKTADINGPVKIGVILPLTGDAAAYGEPARQVMEIAMEEINADGGINGNPIEFVVEDGKCDGTGGANAAQKLINVDKVQVILGGFCSSETLSAEPIATQAKVALFSEGSSSPKLTGISKYFARNYPSDSTQGSVLANVAFTDKGWKKVAFIQEQKDYPLGIQTAFTEAFTKLGGTVSIEEFPETATDFRSLIAKAKAAAPDALFVDTQTAAAANRILKQLSESGWTPPLLITDTTVADPETLKNNAAILEGALAAEMGVDLTNPKFANLVATYKAKYGTDVPFQSYAQTEYDAVYLVRNAIKEVGYDGTKIANWLRNVKNWQGAAGSVTIGDNGDPVAGHRPETVKGGVVTPYVK